MGDLAVKSRLVAVISAQKVPMIHAIIGERQYIINAAHAEKNK
jgi:hypothetical protein